MRASIRRIAVLGAFLTLPLFGLAPTSAIADTAEEISALPVLDPLNRTEVPLSNGGKWSALNWAGGGNPTGQDNTTGWGPASNLPTVNGAYWNPSSLTDKWGSAAAITMSTMTSAENYMSLWIDMPNPGSTKSGYELRYTPAAGGGYAVKLSKWAAGTETVLASNPSVSVFNGATMAISDTGGTVTAWQKASGASTFSSLLSASDATFTSGYAGIEGGGFSRNTNFKAGVFLSGTAEEIAALPTLDALNRDEIPLSNGGRWAALGWAGGANPRGMDTTIGWGPYSNLPTINGAYWTPTTFTDKAGNAAAITTTHLPSAENYISLWLNMPNPGSAKSGYQLRYTPAAGGGYAVKLSKWSAGTETVLASNPSVSVFNGVSLAISDTGATVTAWQKASGASAFSPLLSANDSTYSGGYAGIEGGGYNRDVNFKAGTFFDPTAQEIAALPTLDALNREETPLSNGGKWTAPSWAGGGHPRGMDTTIGWGPYSNLPTINGAYWTPGSFTDQSGNAATITMTHLPMAENYTSLWLDMADPDSAKSGYQLRYTPGPNETYAVKLSKWSAGAETVLASTSPVLIPNGTTMAISDTGSRVTAWQKPAGAGTFTSLLSANDSTYSGGYAGIEGGGYSRNSAFKAGMLVDPTDKTAPDTTITGGPNGTTNDPTPSFTFTATQVGSTFECSLDGAAFSACSSPTEYPTMQEGSSHTFQVRATDSSGNQDASPAQRTFKIETASNVSAMTAIRGSSGSLWLNAPQLGGALNTGLGMGGTSSPSIANFPAGDHLIAYRASSGNLWTYSPTTKESTNLQLGVKAGTSPSITALADGSYVIAFQANDGNLWTYSSKTSWKNEQLGMKAGTSPSIAALTGGHYVIAFQASDGNLWTYESNTATATNRQLGMKAETSPSVAMMTDLSFLAAFQASDGNLWTYSSKTGWKNQQLGMKAATSPSAIGLSDGSHVIAFQAGSGYLWTFSSKTGSANRGLGMQAGTSPSIAWLGPNTYSVAIQANNGVLWTYSSATNSGTSQGLAMSEGTSPAEAYDRPDTTITSKHPTYTSGEAQSITFASDEPGSTFKCSIDEPYNTTPCTNPYSLLAGQLGTGWHTFYVTAVDKDGNLDPTPASWTFKTLPYPPAPAGSELISPTEGAVSSSHYVLNAKWGYSPSEGQVSGVTFQIKLSQWPEFRTIPAQYVRGPDGKQVTWPLQVTTQTGSTGPVYFAGRDYPGFEFPFINEKDVKFRAVFDGERNAAGASAPVTTEFSRRYSAPGNARATIGPASLDLVTGQYTVSATDVSIPVPGTSAKLEFSRVYDNTRLPYAKNEVLGRWDPSLPVETEAEGAWQSIKVRHEDAVPPYYDPECEEEVGKIEECMVEEGIPAADWVELRDDLNEDHPFDQVGGSYVAPDYLKDVVLSKEEGRFVLRESSGSETYFTPSGDPSIYIPTTVVIKGSPQSVSAVYTGGRLSKLIAPTAAGVTCTPDNVSYAEGCRSLWFDYMPLKTWWPGSPYGDVERLAWITYYNGSGDAGTAEVVAQYKYDSVGKLIRAVDPRVSVSGTQYTYDTEEDDWYLKTITPPKQEPWKFSYYDGSKHLRLKSVSRASLTSPAEAQTTIVYDVPISGSGAPYDMSAAEVAKWGQSRYPVDATAIFPPDQIPGEPPTDYSHATVHYMDAEGHQVNSASPPLPGASGPSIVTSEMDSKGNEIRSLSAQNRLFALSATNSVARSQELDSHYTYSADGTEMLESWGPLHKVRLESGETVEARQHTKFEYDQGYVPTDLEKAKGVPAPHFPTKETTAAAVSGVDKDVQVTETKYDWALRKPTETVVDPEVPGGPLELNLRARTVYDPVTGQVTEERQPSNPEGGSAGTTRTTYYQAGDHSPTECKSSKWAGLPCVVHPAAAPSPTGSNPPMPWTWYTSYSILDAPAKVEDKTNGVVKRTTTVEYDQAGRPIEVKVTGEGTSLPASKISYDPETGAVTSQELVCKAPENCTGFDNQKLTTTYDKLGRPVKYEDADGSKPEIAYDLMGRPAIVGDGKGIQASTYDAATGALVGLSDEHAGNFTATYNADGAILTQGLPNGLTQEIAYDPTGAAVHVRYQKTTNCSSNCTWLQYDVQESVHGQWLKHTGLQSTQEYSYDKAGRLVLNKDTPQGGACTTRAYSFDANSNRTKLVTRTATIGNPCNTTTGGTTKEYAYDTGDRLVGAGIAYDSLGRITSLAGAYAGGGALTTGFYVNDLVRVQTQDGLTNTYHLDAAMRQRQRVQTGTKSGSEIYHYAGSSDSPTWIDRGSGWSRNIPGIDGDLVAVHDSASGTALQLTNLHGDVVATASLDPFATKPLSSQEFDEFGIPKQVGGARFGWLGGNQRRTELPSGVIQMGVRSYVPVIGRFLSPDPVRGGSANAYEYGNGDPINNFDLDGQRAKNHPKKGGGGGKGGGRGRGGGGGGRKPARKPPRAPKSSANAPRGAATTAERRKKNPFAYPDHYEECLRRVKCYAKPPKKGCGQRGVQEWCPGTREPEKPDYCDRHWLFAPIHHLPQEFAECGPPTGSPVPPRYPGWVR